MAILKKLVVWQDVLVRTFTKPHNPKNRCQMCVVRSPADNRLQRGNSSSFWCLFRVSNLYAAMSVNENHQTSTTNLTPEGREVAVSLCQLPDDMD